MRVALVVERFAATGGGVEQASWQVAAALAAAGVRTEVLCRESAGAPPDVAVTTLPVSAAYQPWRVLAFARRVARTVAARRADFDVVHAFARTPGHDVYRAGAGRHATAMHCSYGAAGAALRRLSPRHAVQLRADRRIFAAPASFIQCPSQLVRDDLLAHTQVDPRRLVVIANAVDAERFRPGRDHAARALRAQHARAGETVWLFAGSGARRKGLDVAIAALARGRDRHGVLWVAGRDDPARGRRLARRHGVGERVRFLGLRDDMPEVYRAADGLLLPTRYDPCANACLEAAASGLPVIGTRRDGAMEQLDGAGVVVADAEDIAEVARALDALSDPDRRRAAAATARKRAEACDFARHATALQALYARVIEARRASAAGEPA